MERDEMVKKQSFLKGSVILMVSAAAAKVLGALFKIPLTNMLGGVGMSYFSCAYSLFMPVYALTVTGISSAVARLTARSAALGAYENAERVRRTAMALFSAAGLAGSFITLLLAVPFSKYSADSPEAALAVAMISPAVFLGCITSVERGYYEGLSNMYPTALSQVAEGIVKIGAGLFLCGYTIDHDDEIMRYFPFITDVRVLAAAAGILGVTASSLGALLFFAVLRAFTHTPVVSEKAVMSRREIVHELIAMALPIGISAVVTNLTSLIDMWTVIGLVRESGSVAGIASEDYPKFAYGSFAGIALTVFNLVPSVTNMLGKGALTLITSDWESGDRSGLRRDTMQALTISLIMAMPAAVGMGVLSEEILNFLFPRQTDEAALCTVPLRLLMPGMVCLCMSFPLFSMLQAIGRTALPLKIMAFGTAFKLAGNILLIPRMGVDGAALSTTFCYILILVLALRAYIIHSGVGLAAAPFAGTVYAGAMCGGMAWLVKSLLAGRGDMTVIILSGAAGGAIYLICLWLCLGKSLKIKEPA
ncbi:MAG TPA: polysaccharide biosynthesis protein [Ruminococcus sp.]|nr:polysaccharide biosynthesis protein [Ruminococcus sp.]